MICPKCGREFQDNSGEAVLISTLLNCYDCLVNEKPYGEIAEMPNYWQKKVKNSPCEDGAYSIRETHNFSECIRYSESGDYPESRSE